MLDLFNKNFKNVKIASLYQARIIIKTYPIGGNFY